MTLQFSVVQNATCGAGVQVRHTFPNDFAFLLPLVVRLSPRPSTTTWGTSATLKRADGTWSGATRQTGAGARIRCPRPVEIAGLVNAETISRVAAAAASAKDILPQGDVGSSSSNAGPGLCRARLKESPSLRQHLVVERRVYSPTTN